MSIAGNVIFHQNSIEEGNISLLNELPFDKSEKISISWDPF
jgi:hypothetical protein